MDSKVITQICLVVAVVVAIMQWTGALAQSGCTSELASLYPCLNYVTGNSSSPSPTCCTQLAGVVKSQPRCLCSLLNGGASSVGINVNQTLALALPGACQVQTPPSSQCNAGNAPTSSPAPAGSPPADSSNETPETQTTPSASDTPAANGSKTVPSTDGSASAGISIKASFQILGLLLFVASYVVFGVEF
ncbi:hypothetical protein ACH5RR_010644 [Cinchona calisaya]|uniref:Bifunctional inhibitor/plant lipid transfer protein/seed storage helical domain-containing protein n=1 Tax=Cinchona calisaya TaxID=153742 RepID=A0ABD3AJI8_9GENT